MSPRRCCENCSMAEWILGQNNEEISRMFRNNSKECPANRNSTKPTRRTACTCTFSDILTLAFLKSRPSKPLVVLKICQRPSCNWRATQNLQKAHSKAPQQQKQKNRALATAVHLKVWRRHAQNVCDYQVVELTEVR